MNDTHDESGQVPARNAVLVVLPILLAVVLLFWPSIDWLIGEWFSKDTLDHSVVVAAIACLLFLRAAWLMPLDALQPNWLALAATFGLSLVWLLASAANIATGQVFLLPLLLFAAIAGVLGWRQAKPMLFPAFFLFFALPVWDPLKGPLRELTIAVVGKLLQVAGVAAIIEGSLVHIPAGSFRIANGCSGLNFFIVGSALALLFGHLFYRSIAKRLTLLAIGIAIALLGNWIRVASIIAIGDMTEMQSGIIEDHHAFGWGIFAVLQILFFAIAMRMGNGEATPVDSDRYRRAWWPVRRPALILLSLAGLAVGPLWAASVLDRDADASVRRIGLPPGNADWVGPYGNRGGWNPVYHGNTAEALGQYSSVDGSVWLYLNVYMTQEQGRELIFMHNRLQGEYAAGSETQRQVRTDDGRAHSVRDLIVDQGYRQRRIMYWYEIDGHRVADELRAKLIQARAVLLGRPAAGVVAVSAVCEFDCRSAGERIHRFISFLTSDFQLIEQVEQGAT